LFRQIKFFLNIPSTYVGDNGKNLLNAGQQKRNCVELVLNPQRKGSSDQGRQHSKIFLETSLKQTLLWWKKIQNILLGNFRLTKKSSSKKILVSASHYIGNLFHARIFLPELCALFRAEAACFSFEAVPDKDKLRWLKNLSCPCLLGERELRPFQQQAETIAQLLLQKFVNQETLINYCIDKIPLGILIHDHYLRRKCVAQVDLKDPEFLRDLILGIKIYLTTKNYFENNSTVLIWADHPVYLESGVILQVAAKYGIPCLHLGGGSSPMAFFIYPPKTRRKEHALKMAYQIPYEEFPSLFKKLSLEQKRRALSWAKKSLHRHLGGGKKEIVAGGHTPFRLVARKKLIRSSRIEALVLPRDFSDAPNVYGKMLFPDNLSWLTFVLKESQKTNFPWALKPHPNRWSGDGEKMNRLNQAVLEKIRLQFPHVEFLEPHTSYYELIQRGLRTVFTPCGSVGHELPALGVAVVNGGRNPHISYNFNYHPASRKKLASLIRKADKLRPINTKKIPEFYYMYYKFLEDTSSVKNLWPKRLDQAFQVTQDLPSSLGLKRLAGEFPVLKTQSSKIQNHFKNEKMQLTKKAF